MKIKLASGAGTFYTPPALINGLFMAKSKKVKAEWVCQDCKKRNGVIQVMKDKIKELSRNKYCPKSRVQEFHKAKLIKKAN